MTTKELTPIEWYTEISRGLDYRRKYGVEDSWGKLESLLYNVHPSQANSGPNILLSTLDSLASAMNVPNPYVTIKARNQRSVAKSKYLESTDNLLIDQMDLQVEIERVTASTFLWGRGFLKIGYDSEFGFSDTLDIGLFQKTGYTMSRWDKDGNLLEYNKVRPGMPWAKCCLPHDIVVPWGVFDVQESPWIANRIVRHIDAIRADTKYDCKAARRIEPNMSMKDFADSYTNTHKPYRLGTPQVFVADSLRKDSEGMDYVELWEIKDQRTKKVMVMPTNGKAWLRNDVDGLQIQGLPYTSMSFIPRTRNFWTTPDAFYLLYHQADLSDIAVQTTKHRRLSKLKMIYDKEVIDKETAQQIADGDIGAFIGVNASGQALQNSLMPFTAPVPNMTLYQDAEATRRNAREMVGFSQNQIGEFESSGRRTATEAQIVQQGSGLRLDRRQNQLRRMYVDTFQIINNIIFKYWKTPRVVEVVGDDGKEQWYPITGQDLQGEYNYRIGFSVGGNESLQERRQVATQMFFQMIQTGLFDPIKLSRYLAAAWNDAEFTATFKDGVINGTASQGQASFQGASGGNGMGQGQVQQASAQGQGQELQAAV